ncbi:ABC transporter permease [Micromonospora sp. NPDC049497]|uniref:ABC transporter permease n=1 Tax=Micromonospora sp. NPDC049497 TaxID=3364273 RepID=UPI0037A9F95A
MSYDDPGRAAPGESSSAIPAAVLENVFDDPAHGEPGRDRLVVHLVWETLLLVALAAGTYLLWQEAPDTLRGDGLRDLLTDVVVLGLLTLAAGLSLRAATVNLAIGPVAVAAALHMAEQGDRGLTAAGGPALAVATLGGLVLALVVVVLHVPAWAAGLAGAAGVVVYVEQRTGAVLPQGTYDPERDALPLFAGFAAVAVLGGVFGAVRAVRRMVGRFRPVVDPARRRGLVAALVAVGAIVGSTVLAMLAGLLLGTAGADPVTPGTGLDWTVLAVGTSLLAGTSAYGRRGGIFGTLLAVSLVTVVLAYAEARGWTVDRWALGAVTLGIGLVVTRVVEAYGRPASAPEPLPATDGRISTGWTVPRADPPATWPPAMPERSAEEPVDPWDGSRWETGPRRWDTEDR